jgi:hypothetical protein
MLVLRRVEKICRRELTLSARLLRLFKSGFEIPVHGDRKVVAESGAWCNDLEGRCQKGELR